MPIQTLSDQHHRALLEDARRGDVQAFYELVKPCERSIYLAAFSLLGNQEEAEEVAEEAVLAAYKSVSECPEGSKFNTWLVQITIQQATLCLQQQEQPLPASAEEESNFTPAEFAVWQEIPASALETRELRDQLTQALASLPTRERSVFVMHDVEKLSVQETATMLGIAQGAVKDCLLQARLRMREALAPGLGGPWDQPGIKSRNVRHDAARPTIQ